MYVWIGEYGGEGIRLGLCALGSYGVVDVRAFAWRVGKVCIEGKSGVV